MMKKTWSATSVNADASNRFVARIRPLSTVKKCKELKKQSGQSLLEMAIVLPVLLMLLMGIFDFGRVLYSYMHLHMATQESVRIAGLGAKDAKIEQFARDYINIGDPSKLQVTISPNEDNRDPGDYVMVTLQYPVEIFTPFVSSILPDPLQVDTKSTIRVE